MQLPLILLLPLVVLAKSAESKREEEAFVESGVWLGVILACLGNLLISFSLNLQKYFHNKNQVLDTPIPYLKAPLWWIGTALMIGGEVGNFTAFAFAPAAVVTPLGAVSVIGNSVIAPVMNKEKFRRRDLVGVILSIVGSTIIVVAAPNETLVLDAMQFVMHVIDIGFLVWIGIVVVSTTVLCFVATKHGKRHVLIYIMICSLLGSLSVMCAKGISMQIRITLQYWPHRNQFAYVTPWVIGPMVGVFAFLQIRFLNKAMQAFGNTEVVPVYYVTFTICVIIGGILLFREFFGLSVWHMIAFGVGCLVTFYGVYLITSKRAPPPAAASNVNTPDDGSDEEKKDEASGQYGATAGSPATARVRSDRPLPSDPEEQSDDGLEEKWLLLSEGQHKIADRKAIGVQGSGGGIKLINAVERGYHALEAQLGIDEPDPQAWPPGYDLQQPYGLGLGLPLAWTGSMAAKAAREVASAAVVAPLMRASTRGGPPLPPPPAVLDGRRRGSDPGSPMPARDRYGSMVSVEPEVTEAETQPPPVDSTPMTFGGPPASILTI